MPASLASDLARGRTSPLAPVSITSGQGQNVCVPVQTEERRSTLQAIGTPGDCVLAGDPPMMTGRADPDQRVALWRPHAVRPVPAGDRSGDRKGVWARPLGGTAYEGCAGKPLLAPALSRAAPGRRSSIGGPGAQPTSDLETAGRRACAAVRGKEAGDQSSFIARRRRACWRRRKLRLDRPCPGPPARPRPPVCAGTAPWGGSKDVAC